MIYADCLLGRFRITACSQMLAEGPMAVLVGPESVVTEMAGFADHLPTF
jgi:hypothetical protein